MSADGSPSAREQPRSRRRRARNALLALAASAVVALLAGELALRVFLFHPSLAPRALALKFRQPGWYANGDDEDDYWKLTCALQGEAALADAPVPDPRLGWVSSGILPGTYAHADEGLLRGRRPVLLYGDSFAQCTTPARECFQAFLENSELSDRFALLNYGVSGYGLDQIYLLLASSIDRYRDRDPFVIVSFLVDSDFERSVLEFRCWPKPRLDLAGDRLVPRGPVQTNVREYLAQHPISIRSYLWRLFLHHGSSFLAESRERWRGSERVDAEKRRLNLRILTEIERELSSRGVQHCFLMFHSESGALRRWEAFAWQEQMVEDFCAEHAVPWFDTRAWLSFAADGDERKCMAYYGRPGSNEGHHTALGNLICFEAIRQALIGPPGAPDVRHLASLRARGMLEPGGAETTECELLGRKATLITHGSLGATRALETRDPPRLTLRADAAGTTVLELELAGGAKRLTGSLHTLAGTRNGCPGDGIVFRVEVDGALVLRTEVPPAERALQLDVDLAGKQRVALHVEGERGGGGCSWIAIDEPRLD